MIEAIVKLKNFANSKYMRFLDVFLALSLFAYGSYQVYSGSDSSGCFNIFLAAIIGLVAYCQPAIWLEKKLSGIIVKRRSA